jgi:hypothetical protein
VESLLKLNSATALVDQPAWQAAGELLDNNSSMAVGARSGPYRIEGLLGAGGMVRCIGRAIHGWIARQEESIPEPCDLLDELPRRSAAPDAIPVTRGLAAVAFHE